MSDFCVNVSTIIQLQVQHFESVQHDRKRRQVVLFLLEFHANALLGYIIFSSRLHSLMQHAIYAYYNFFLMMMMSDCSVHVHGSTHSATPLMALYKSVY